MTDTSQARRRWFEHNAARGEISVLGRGFRLPRNRGARIALGVSFVLLGLLGFLPILGYWMVPVGLLILSQDFAMVRRWRRSFDVWLGRRRHRRKIQDGAPGV